MKKKHVAKLAKISYIDNQIDEDRVNKITHHLDNHLLREYLKAMRRLENKSIVYIDYALDLSDDNKEKIEQLFPDKKVIFRKDPDLLLGIRITEDDMVYNVNMNNALEQIRNYINRSI